MHISLPTKVKNCKEYMLREAGIRLNMPIQTINDAIIYLKIQLYTNQVIRLSPAHSLGKDASTLD